MVDREADRLYHVHFDTQQKAVQVMMKTAADYASAPEMSETSNTLTDWKPKAQSSTCKQQCANLAANVRETDAVVANLTIVDERCAHLSLL